MRKLLFVLSVALFCSTALYAAFTPAAFSVSADKQVAFSKGNLQCTLSATDTTWAFADDQTEMLGTDNVSGDALADKIDLFGWSGSTGSAKWGISTSTTASDYAGDFVDWGTNTIGTAAPNTYRTLTIDEWNYLLNTRANAGEKKGVARIQISNTEYANGFILLPDSWTCPEDVTFKSGFASEWSINAYATYQTFTLAEWQKLEAAGAVFLPASSNRRGSSMYAVQKGGYYGSATAYGSSYACYLYILSLEARVSNGVRSTGYAVRLVHDIKYAITLTTPEHGTIAADKTEAVVGETVTLTVSTNDAYYVPKIITVMQGETPITATAVEGATNQYTFTMPKGEVTVSAEFEKIASAFTPAAFSVAAGKQVSFSQGNLQCTLSATDTTWAFAEYQTEMLGGALADKIDLYGWSGSTGSAKWGISTSTNNNDYSGDFVDWGTNTIGTAAPNTYRTLTNDEWNYLRYTRTNADNLMGIARIKLSDTEYVNGLVLLPDSWTCPAGVQFTSGFSSNYSEQAYANYQTLTLAQWQQLEAAGAVFLPAMGHRNGSSRNLMQFYGYYWAATALDSDNAYYFRFHSQEATVYDVYRSYGLAVRLVRDIKYAITLTTPEHGTIAADKTEAAAGETVTLTVTPDAYYQLKAITVMQGETPITATAVGGTTNQYTFTMPKGEVTITAEFEKVASAFTPAKFTVSAYSKQVTFSQGNLQCALSATDTTWAFAEYQTEMIGNANVSGGALANTIDLFGWSAANETEKWGISTSTNNSDYSGDFVDWGTNTIGTAAPNTYRTLTKNEWAYLLNTRTNANEKKGVARIKLSDTEYANGLILLPDSWTCPEGVTFKSGFASSYSVQTYADYQTFTLAEWQKLESAGAVFLPASGNRLGSSMYDVQNLGRYWSASVLHSSAAYGLRVRSDGADESTNYRRLGHAVRLVQDLYAITLTTPEHGTITADKTEAVAGETVTLTVTPDTDYELDVLTVKDAANNDIKVTNNTFTMPASAVTVTATFKLQTFTITRTTSEHGTIAADKTEAAAGETVTLTVTPDAYYQLKTITVTYGEGETVAVTSDNTFTMPAGEVSVTAEFEKIASAFTPAKFTVSASGKQVLFSQGNLQCTLSATDTTWAFAEYQTEMIGANNISAGKLADKIDLFGWSGNNTTAPWGISTSKNTSDYAGDFVDWGQNTIGKNAPNTYRTLANDEWDYLLNTRANASEKKGVARIKLNSDGSQYANGLILLPDSWNAPEGVTLTSGFSSESSIDAYATYQTFTLAEWQQLEAAGAVFLPVSGYRLGASVNDVQYNGSYGSATLLSSVLAYYLDFYANGASANYCGRHIGQAVRLVQDIYAVTITQPEHGTIAADKTEAAAVETVTLTVSSDAYYQLKTITVTYGEGETVAVTSDNTFTMPAGEVTVSAEFEKIASAFTPAAFSVAAGKQVSFSQGNLQCTLSATDTTWAFAEYQTEMIGTDNVSGGTMEYDEYWGYEKEDGEALADKIDLFGWSGNNTTAPWGISTSTSESDYAGDFVDWGTNTIGTYAPNTYRTLTKDEWSYLLYERTNAEDRMGVAHIYLNGDGTQYANGIVLLPDNWTVPAGITFKSGFSYPYSVPAYADYQTFTLAEWQQLEAAGAVFLPASGYRYGLEMYEVQFGGNYCYATAYNSDNSDSLYYAYYMYFYPDELKINSGEYYYGQAVRLVQDLYTVTLTTPEHGTVTADKTEAAAGDEVTLTVTPNAGYELDVLTVQDAAGNPITVDDNKFTMPASNVTVSATFKQTTPTAIGNTTGTADTSVRKVLRNGQVLILRDGKIYTTMGIEVK